MIILLLLLYGSKPHTIQVAVCERAYDHSHAWTSGLVGLSSSLIILLNYTLSRIFFFCRYSAYDIILYGFYFTYVNLVWFHFFFHSRNIIVTIQSFCAYPTEIVISWKFLTPNWHIRGHTRYWPPIRMDRSKR